MYFLKLYWSIVMYKYRLTVQGLHHDNCYRIVPWHHFCVMLFAKIIWGHEIVNNVWMFSGSGKKIRIVASSLFVLKWEITGNHNSSIFILCYLYGKGFFLSWWLSGDSWKQYYPRMFICSCTQCQVPGVHQIQKVFHAILIETTCKPTFCH